MPNRNSIGHFAVNPQVNISRSRMDLNSTVKFTGNTGMLIPFYLAEVLPGDTFEVQTSLVCRLQTLIHPIMDNMYLDTYYFFVPNRLVWDNWQKFCGEPDQAWIPSREYTVPKVIVDPSPYYDGSGTDEEKFNNFYSAFKDTPLDYLGGAITRDMFLPVKFNALPLRGYQKIWDDWFRDENLQNPVNLYTGDDDNTIIGTGQSLGDPLNYLRPANKLHDYFTSALPQAQRGDPVNVLGDVSIPGVSGDFPVITKYQRSQPDNSPSLFLSQRNSSNYGRLKFGVYDQENTFYPAGLVQTNTSQGTDQTYFATPTNLWASISSDGISGLSLTVNDLRLAFQVQKFMEKSARGGARYIELLKTMFGVTSPDSRLQRSEYLGGHRVPINIHQIVNQTETLETPLGNVGAMSLTTDSHDDFVHSFVEHGFVIGLCVVRYKHSYSQGINRLWLRNTKFDYYWPVFANIGEQPIRTDEIYYKSVQGQDENQIFGYQEAWADYRYIPDRVAGEMRPGVPNTLASWHLGDYYTTAPTLGPAWIEESKAPVDRAIAVTSSVADQLLFDVYIKNKATRPMPVYSIPGLVDHH